MCEKPILMSVPMVRAILEGRKTMTRRVIKPQPPIGWNWCGWQIEGNRRLDGTAQWSKEPTGSSITTGRHAVRCPYGQPGDRLWVRETFFERVDPNTSKMCDPPQYEYRATCEDVDGAYIDDGDGCPVENKDGTIASPWRPSIHMPRKASRINLKITAVRVERLQDISSQDAWSEGVQCSCAAPSWPYCDGNIKAFHDLWDSINAKRGYGWDFNPWVWVVEFKRIDNESKADIKK